jgi:hypothetical protein
MSSELLFVWEKPHSLVACFFTNHGKRRMCLWLTQTLWGLEMLLHLLQLAICIFSIGAQPSNLWSLVFWTLGRSNLDCLYTELCLTFNGLLCVLFPKFLREKIRDQVYMWVVDKSSSTHISYLVLYQCSAHAT